MFGYCRRGITKVCSSLTRTFAGNRPDGTKGKTVTNRPATAASQRIAAPLILNVDDYHPARYARDRLLQGHGFLVASAATGKQAMILAHERRPDLILLDIHLPDADGRELCQQIKADESLRGIPVVLISATATSDASQLEGIHWAGADGFLREPVEAAELVSTLRKLLPTS